MNFIKIRGIYYNVMYIKSVRVLRSNRAGYEYEVMVEVEGSAGDCYGFRSREEAEEFQNDILAQVIIYDTE